MVFSVAVSPWRRRGRERDELRNVSRCSRRRAWGHPLEKLRKRLPGFPSTVSCTHVMVCVCVCVCVCVVGEGGHELELI